MKRIHLGTPEITFKQDVESSVMNSVRTIVLRDLNLGLRPAKFARSFVRDQTNKHVLIVD